eukprot:4031072-Pleurochrysis_carterae.AAC.1
MLFAANEGGAPAPGAPRRGSAVAPRACSVGSAPACDASSASSLVSASRPGARLALPLFGPRCSR